MTIFEALRQSHDQQRALCEALTATQGKSDERSHLFQTLSIELVAHAGAEERQFYVPLMAHDNGLDLSRHAIAEHHEIDELLAQLAATDQSSPAWLVTAKKLAETVIHHLHEEEQKFFQMAGKILTEQEKSTLAKAYISEFEQLKSSL